MSFLPKLFRLSARRVCAALVFSLAAVPAFAVPIMDMNLEDLMPMIADFKKSLNLNANQSLLWQQTEGRTRQLLRDRKARREHLQSATRGALDGKQVELRDLVGAVDAETAASAAEEKQLREWWLTVNDALSDTQRAAVVRLLTEQMERVAEPMGRAGGGDKPSDGGGEHRGGRGGRGGGSGGPGGVGVGVGAGGASINLPGGG